VALVNDDRKTNDQEFVARKVWGDAQEAISRLQSRENNDPLSNWRPDFIAAVALLRAIGHVLDKVDGERDKEMRRRIDERWEGMKQDPIFRWIEDSRNDALKAYEIPIEQVRITEWSGPAKSPEDADDAKDTSMLFLKDNSQPALDHLWTAWKWWGEALAAIKHDHPSKWPGATW
jgi:hypothetical protein